MGCCASRPSPSSPYPTAAPSASSRAINHNSSQPASQTALPRPSTNHTTSSSQQPHPHPHLRLHSHQQPPPLNERFNKPLRPHIWASSNRAWTRRQIDREREEFFDTRVTGQPEIWQTIKAALEVLWAGGDPGDDSNDGGIATASMILQAAGVTLPRGDLVGGVYDINGDFYSLPEHIVADPENILVGEEPDKDGEEISDEGDEEEAQRRREEKGKAVLAPEDVITVKARLSDRGGPTADIVVQIGKGDSVRLLAKRVCEEAELRPSQRVRIVYLGKMLKENETLLAQSWKDDHVVNALVFD